MRTLLFLLLLPVFSFAQCADVKLVSNKAKTSDRWQTPDTNAVQFTRTAKGSAVVYRVQLRITGREVNIGQQGIVITFDNGATLVKPDEMVDVVNMDGDFEYSAGFTLSPEEFNVFKKNRVVQFDLAHYQKALTTQEQEKYRSYARCIVSK
jgi:hypothetical protein